MFDLCLPLAAFDKLQLTFKYRRAEIRFPAIRAVTIKMIGKRECVWLRVRILVGLELRSYVRAQLLAT